MQELVIKDENVRPHLDIEADIQQQKDGLFTFNLRIHSGKVVDYQLWDYVDSKQYFEYVKRVTVQEFTATYHSGERDTKDPVRSDNGKREAKGGGSST